MTITELKEKYKKTKELRDEKARQIEEILTSEQETSPEKVLDKLKRKQRIICTANKNMKEIIGKIQEIQEIELLKELNEVKK